MPPEQPAYSSQYNLLGPRFAPQDETVLCPAPAFRCRKDVLRPRLLSDEGCQRHFMFEDGGIGLSDTWRRINVVLVLPSREGSGTYRPRPGTFTPFVHISHALKTFCILRTPGVTPEMRPITFTTAVKFATDPQTLPTSGANPPPFLQLYDESGEPRLPDPLPLYSPAREKTNPMLEVEGTLLVPSDIVMSSESSDEDTPAGRPLSPAHRPSQDIVLPESTSASTLPAAEGYPKPTLGRASGSRSLHVDARDVDGQV